MIDMRNVATSHAGFVSQRSDNGFGLALASCGLCYPSAPSLKVAAHVFCGAAGCTIDQGQFSKGLSSVIPIALSAAPASARRA
jgi:hypothetical protein